MKRWRFQILDRRRRARARPGLELDWRLMAVGLRDCFGGKHATHGEPAREAAPRGEVRLPSGIVLRKP
ncbi:MAG: hypothetical protein WHT82_08245 [Limisphaera sp.]